jgi:hypothetical protein
MLASHGDLTGEETLPAVAADSMTEADFLADDSNGIRRAIATSSSGKAY